jgi:hypothetical protein
MRITIDIDDKWLLYAKYQAVQQECVIFLASNIRLLDSKSGSLFRL